MPHYSDNEQMRCIPARIDRPPQEDRLNAIQMTISAFHVLPSSAVIQKSLEQQVAALGVGSQVLGVYSGLAAGEEPLDGEDDEGDDSTDSTEQLPPPTPLEQVAVMLAAALEDNLPEVQVAADITSFLVKAYAPKKTPYKTGKERIAESKVRPRPVKPPVMPVANPIAAPKKETGDDAAQEVAAHEAGD